jgi:hypothetical protein
MSGIAHSPSQEFWQPPLAQTIPVQEAGRRVAACDTCSAEFIVGARYCHVCGGDREAQTTGRSLAHYFEFHHIKDALGLGAASLIAFIFGAACGLAAIFTGLFFTASTVLDWQAVQLWRIEWLLAATASFVAGILLKKSH